MVMLLEHAGCSIEFQRISAASPKRKFELLEHSVYVGKRFLRAISASERTKLSTFDADDRLLGRFKDVRSDYKQTLQAGKGQTIVDHRGKRSPRNDFNRNLSMPYVPPKHCFHCGSLLEPIAGKPGQLSCSADQCRTINYLSPLPVVAGIIEHEDHVILVRGHGWPESWYGLVTGFLEFEEHPEAAVRREVGEELGLVVETSRLVGVYPFAQMNQVIIAYHLTASGEIVIDDSELAGFKRVPSDELTPWDFGTGPAVRDFLALRRAGVPLPR